MQASFSQLKSKVTISLTLAALGIYAYNKYDDFPSFNDVKNLLYSKFNFVKKIEPNNMIEPENMTESPDNDHV
tara:strand:- start:374 stop:592 length:219 start_codon:yes stop_codon:yes gene_type:complete